MSSQNDMASSIASCTFGLSKLRSGWWLKNRRQYYWHRFFSHQPDLNFDNPKVLEAMLEAMSFWLDMGLDGFRLDAVPYLYERPGTNGENLPETHVVLKKIRGITGKWNAMWHSSPPVAGSPK